MRNSFNMKNLSKTKFGEIKICFNNYPKYYFGCFRLPLIYNGLI